MVLFTRFRTEHSYALVVPRSAFEPSAPRTTPVSTCRGYVSSCFSRFLVFQQGPTMSASWGWHLAGTCHGAPLPPSRSSSSPRPSAAPVPPSRSSSSPRLSARPSAQVLGQRSLPRLIPPVPREVSAIGELLAGSRPFISLLKGVLS